MATLTGSGLVSSILETTGIELSTVEQALISQKIQYDIDNGTNSSMSTTLTLMGLSADAKAKAAASDEGTTAFVNNLNATTAEAVTVIEAAEETTDPEEPTEAEAEELQAAIDAAADASVALTLISSTATDVEVAEATLLAAQTEEAAIALGATAEDIASAATVVLLEIKADALDTVAEATYRLSVIPEGEDTTEAAALVASTTTEANAAGASTSEISTAFNEYKAAAEALVDAAAQATYDLNTSVEGATQTAVDTAVAAALEVGATQALIDAGVAVLEEAAIQAAAIELTINKDILVGTDGSDLFTATDATLGATDIIVDESSTDNDTLELTIGLDSAAATITGIENVNISLQEDDLAVAAGNISDATITLSQNTLGVDGIVTVNLSSDNNVTAGTGITDITVADATDGVTGTVDTGSATDATITGKANTSTNLVVNGDLTLGVTGSTDVNITTTAAADITYTPAAATTTIINGAVDTELSMISANVATTFEVVNNLTDDATLTLNITDDSTADTTTFDVDVVNLEEESTSLAVNSGMHITTELVQDTLEISSVSDTAAINEVTLTTGFGLTTTTTFTDIKTANIIATDDIVITKLIIDDGATAAISGTADVTVTDIVDATATGGDEKVILNASSLVGALTVTDIYTASGTNDGASAVVYGGSGANDITITDGISATYMGQDAGDTIVVETVDAEKVTLSTGDGIDTITAAAMTESTLTVESNDGNDIINVTNSGTGTLTSGKQTILSGLGNDKVTLGIAALTSGTINATLGGGDDTAYLDVSAGTLAAATLTIDGGEGSDTLDVLDTFTSVDDELTVTLTSIENLVVTDTDDTAIANNAIEFAGSHLSGFTSIDVALASTANATKVDTIKLSVAADETTTDLSALVVSDYGISIDGDNTLENIADPDNTAFSNIYTIITSKDGAANTITGTNATDVVIGKAEDDTITTGEGLDVIYGAAGADIINITESDDILDILVYASIIDGSAVGTAGGTFTGFDVVTGFESGTDKIVFDNSTPATDVTAFATAIAMDGTAIVEATVIVKADGDATDSDNDLDAADYTNVDKIVSFLNDVAPTYLTATTNNANLVAINFDDITAVYSVDGTDTDIVAGEVALIGTFDADLVAGDFVVA
jgi:hypothetical protein